MNNQSIRVVIEWDLLQTFNKFSNCFELGNIISDIHQETADEIQTGSSTLKPITVKIRTTYFQNKDQPQEREIQTAKDQQQEQEPQTTK